MMRTKMLVTVVGGLALAAMGTWGPAGAAERGPIKIGYTAPLTGPAAAVGKDMVNGFQMYVDEVGKRFGDRRVEVIVEDNQGKPDVALTKARKHVESDKVHIMAGLLFAHVGYALAPVVDEYKIPMIYPIVAADDLTPCPQTWRGRP